MQEAIKVVSSNRGLRSARLPSARVRRRGTAARRRRWRDELGMQGVLVPAVPGRHERARSLALRRAPRLRRLGAHRRSTSVEPAPRQRRSSRGCASSGESELLDEGFARDQLRYEYASRSALRRPRLRADGRARRAFPQHGRGDLHDDRARDFDAAARATHRPLGARRARRDRQLPRHRRRDRPAGVVRFAVRRRRDARRRASRRSRDVLRQAKPTQTRLYDRTKLPKGAEIDGPAILLQADSTTVIIPAGRASSSSVDRDRRLQLEIDGGRPVDGSRHLSSHPEPALGDRAGDARQHLPHRLLDDHPRVAGRELHAARRRAATSSASTSSCRCTSRACRECVRAIRRDVRRRHPARRRVHHQPSLRGRRRRTRWTWRSSRRSSTTAG